ncbi:hypothetical protein [Paenibacillus sp. FSL K6-2859]|uniref:hypothetical protein n=1 Tax=Paenibacillus sp. FSL K6-2859 TaxID=2921482 RepID=UPI0030F512AC
MLDQLESTGQPEIQRKTRNLRLVESLFYFREGRGNGGKMRKCSEVAWIDWTARDSTGT